MSISAQLPIVIRELETCAEFRAVEDMQREVWEIPDLDVVPLYQLVAAKESGGVLLGAFHDQVMVAFVYGFVGLERGATVHHSHMLAVKKDWRSKDIGWRLKLAQRERVLDQGIKVMTWTFDPLRSLNAHFNFNKLGVVADRYYVNFYGDDASSPLHRNGTDRFWVLWDLNSENVRRRISECEPPPPDMEAPVAVAMGETGGPQIINLGPSSSDRCVRVQIPENIGVMEIENFELAEAWRSATREAFKGLLQEGFVVDGYFWQAGVGNYTLTRKSAA